jgi:site-specific DNA recombinase
MDRRRRAARPALRVTPFIYVRISDDPSGQRAGVERQRSDCAELIRRRGWGDEPRVYEDNDVSAWKRNVVRPSWVLMLAELHEASALVAYNLDRLLRQPRDLEALLDRCVEVGLSRVATLEGDLDLSTHDGQLQARILAAVAKKSSDDTSRRVKRALRDRAERGAWTGSRPPFGYELVDGALALGPHADIVRDVAARLIDGESLTSIVRSCTVEGAPTTRRGWRVLLLSPSLTGRTRAGSRGWEPILDDTTAANLRAAIEERRPALVHDGRRRNWLVGILECGACGGPMYYVRSRTRYTCRDLDCLAVSIAAPGVDELIEELIFAAAPTIEPEAPAPPPEPDNERLAELAAMYAAGEITRAEWVAARATATARQEAVAVTLPAPIGGTREAWPDLTAIERHRVARWLLRRVVILPVGKGVIVPAAERLVVEWTEH